MGHFEAGELAAERTDDGENAAEVVLDDVVDRYDDPDIDATEAAIDDCDEWPTPWGIKQRSAVIREEWSSAERVRRFRNNGDELPPGFQGPREPDELTADKIALIEAAIFAAGRAIRSCRPPLAAGRDALASFLDRIELAVRCPFGTLLEITNFADRKDAIEREFRAKCRELSLPVHRVHGGAEGLGED
jgi:hypothetical protein